MKFIFIDESGTKKQDRFFSIGFLEVDYPDKYFKGLSIYRDKLFSINRQERSERSELLFKEEKFAELMLLSKNAFKFELKYSRVNNHNINIYSNFVNYLLETSSKYVSISIDREDPSFDDNAKLEASYKRIINLYLKKYIVGTECALIVDDFGVQIANICDSKLLPKYYIRNVSDSNIFLQGVDVLTGLVGYGMKSHLGILPPSKKDLPRKELLDLVETKVGKTLSGNFTAKHSRNRYFINWVIDFSKGHGHLPQSLTN